MSALRVFTSPGRVEDGWLAVAAAELRAAGRSRIPAAPLKQRHPDLALAQAYRIQWTNVEARIIGGARLAGHKVGLTSIAMQQQMGVDEPDSGVLLDDMLVPSGSELNLGDLVVPRVETEIGVRLGRPLRGPDVNADEARDAVCEVFLALEVIDTRYGAWQIALEDSVADNASAARAVVGAAVPLRPCLDLCAEELTLSGNGETAATGEGRAVLGDPLNAVAWLARRLGDYGAGRRSAETGRWSRFPQVCRPSGEPGLTPRTRRHPRRRASTGCRSGDGGELSAEDSRLSRTFNEEGLAMARSARRAHEKDDPPGLADPAEVRRVRTVLALGGVPWDALDDGVQQVRLKLLEEQAKPTRPEVRNPLAWLTVVASRVASDWHRSRSRDAGLRQRLTERWSQPPAEHSEEHRVLALTVAEELESMPAAQRQVLVLRYYVDLPSARWRCSCTSPKERSKAACTLPMRRCGRGCAKWR